MVTDDELREKIAAIPYWYHKIALRPGIITPGWAPLDASKYGVPERLDGETILDVGAWDGYWTFEALKRGAKHVTAIDDFSDTIGGNTNADRSKAWQTFDLCAEALGYRVLRQKWVNEKVNRSTGKVDRWVTDEWEERGYSRYQCNIEEINRDYAEEGYEQIDAFQRVFFFGVMYHLKNPLRALEECYGLMKPGGTIHVETAILDNLVSPYTGQPHDPSGCYAEFYPTNEFGKNSSNWWVPTLKCGGAMLQAAGFVDIESWKYTDTPQHLAECRGFLRARKP